MTAWTCSRKQPSKPAQSDSRELQPNLSAEVAAAALRDAMDRHRHAQQRHERDRQPTSTPVIRAEAVTSSGQQTSAPKKRATRYRACIGAGPGL